MKLRLILPALLALHPAYLYATADVSCLATACVYTPPGKSYQRLAGLDLAQAVPQNVRAGLMSMELYDYDTAWPVQPGRIVMAVAHAAIHHHRIRDTSGMEQQIAKNVFVGSERTIIRKYREAVYATKLYFTYSKEDLLRVYADMAQTGPNTYGFEEAAGKFFHKTAAKLTLAESMAIVHTLPNPQERYAKYYYPLCDGMRDWVMQALLKHGASKESATEEITALNAELSANRKNSN